MEAVGRPEAGGGASFVCGKTMNIVQRSRYGSRALNNMTRDILKARNLTVQTGTLPAFSANSAQHIYHPLLVDPEVRRQAEETVVSCQQQLAMREEERTELDKRQAGLKADVAKVDERLKDINKRKEAIRQIEKMKISLQNRLGSCYTFRSQF
jgi:hypothetical protein